MRFRLWTTAAEMAEVSSGSRLAVAEPEAVEEVDGAGAGAGAADVIGMTG